MFHILRSYFDGLNILNSFADIIYTKYTTN